MLTALKVLCLHGGNGDGASFRQSTGMVALIGAFPNIEFHFPDAPNRVWLLDPPSKSEPFMDNSGEALSRPFLDAYVAEHGPFDGLLGFSQGAAYAPVYFALNPTMFQFMVLFSGYVTTTHPALQQRLVDAKAAGDLDVPVLLWDGALDPMYNAWEPLGGTLFTPSAQYAVIVSETGNHDVPGASDPTFKQVVSFLNFGAEPEESEKQDPFIFPWILLGVAMGGLVVGYWGSVIAYKKH